MKLLLLLLLLKLLIKLLFKLLTKLLLKLLIKLLLKLRIRSLDKVHKEDAALRRQAARKLVPVVLTLGSGPSGFPRKLSARQPWQTRRSRALRYCGSGGWPVGLPETISGRRPKLPRQPWQTHAVARARSVILAKQFSGRRPKLLRQPPSRSLPSFWRWGLARPGFPKQVSERCKAGGSWTPTAMANPRRRTRALRYFGAGGWPVGLLETTFRATAEASATAMANPRRRTRALRYFGAGGWPVGLPETIFRATAKASATASLALASVVLALGVGPTGLPETSFRAMQSGGILDADSHGKPAPSHARAPLFRRWGLARRASRNNLPGEASATAMANPRRRSRMLRYFGAGGWPVGLPETSFRATQSGGILEAAAAYAARSLCRNTGGPDFQGRGPGQWPQWPFYQPEADKWPDL